MSKIELERIINTNNIKYTVLTNIVNESFAGSNANEINIYIDTYSLFKPLFASELEILLGEYNSIISCLVNMASHYRSFFKSRYGVYANIYFIHSSNIPYMNKQFVKEYNTGSVGKFNSNTRMVEYINSNMDIFRVLVQYLPNIYLIDSEFESGVPIYDLMCRTDLNDEKGHLILTKDLYLFQLTTMKPQTVLIRSKRDNSYYVTRNNIMQAYSVERKVKETSQIISPDLFTCILALNGLRERNIKTLFNITKSIRLLETGITENLIFNGYNSDVKRLFNLITQNEAGISISDLSFEFRFKAIDIRFQHSIYMTSPECINLDAMLINKHDPETVKEINNKYFESNPLDLNAL